MQDQDLYWGVRAANAPDGASWAVRRLRIVPVSAPAAPSNQRVTGTTRDSVSLAWNDVGDETGYRIYRWNGSIFVLLASVGANITSYTDRAVSCGNGYSYQVNAYNDYGESSRTDWSDGFTSACATSTPTATNTRVAATATPTATNTRLAAPPMPANLRVASVTQSSISLAWDDGSNETGYRIYRWNGSTFVHLNAVGANVTSHADGSLNCGVGYFYEVSAYNDAGASAHAGSVQGTTAACATSTPIPTATTASAPAAPRNQRVASTTRY
ncbi:MAG: fibronectin type III domain-containing protein [Chloroflexi bacterium]|nr:fibronectin type III domain-containing protein [Chloroflexota bacterium]